MIKQLLGFLLSIYCSFSYAFSPFSDVKVVQITLKDNLPCLYLKDNLPMKYVYIRKLDEEKAQTIFNLTLHHRPVLNKESCFIYGKDVNQPFYYGTPYVVFLGSGVGLETNHHDIEFCVSKNINGIQLVKTRSTYFWEKGIAKCTNKPLA